MCLATPPPHRTHSPQTSISNGCEETLTRSVGVTVTFVTHTVIYVNGLRIAALANL